jgi:exodeoxyribonuclease V
MVDLSSEQQRAADAVDRFIADTSMRQGRSCFVLHGLAGTGKTHLWSHLARKHRGAILVTPTGKAASVLRKRSGLEVKTIHSLIYNFCGLVDDEEIKHKKNPIFTDKEGLNFNRQIVFADEVSMIGRRLAEDLLATGATVVACGDPGQLPPVNDAQFFVEPSAMLTEVHRQASQSPIIRQAHNVRNTGCYEPDGEGFRVIEFAEEDDILQADILLCYMNITRKRLNRKKRSYLGFSGPMKKGEPVMCLKNNHVVGIHNGEIFRLAEDRRADTNISIRDDDGRLVHLGLATVEGESAYDVQRYNDRFTPFAPAYASTVHKAQGSEFPSVLLLDERPRGAERIPFLYTGITRAVEKCTVVSWR